MLGSCRTTSTAPKYTTCLSVPSFPSCASGLQIQAGQGGVRLVGPVLSGDSCETLVGLLPSQSHFVYLSSHLGILCHAASASMGLRWAEMSQLSQSLTEGKLRLLVTRASSNSCAFSSRGETGSCTGAELEGLTFPREKAPCAIYTRGPSPPLHSSQRQASSKEEVTDHS